MKTLMHWNFATYMDYGGAKMISEAINEILNEQINKEFYSGYLYLSMSAYLKELGLNGFASWMKIQAREEVEHGLKIFDYLINCNSFVTLKQIRTPEFEFQEFYQSSTISMNMKKCITRAIMTVAKQAEEECDRTTLSFIDWYIAEQVEEEENVKILLNVLNSLVMIKLHFI